MQKSNENSNATSMKASPNVSEELLNLYRSMQRIRMTEEELARCHQKGLIPGACHTYVGQEAIASGVCAHLTRDDVVFSTHRGHGHALAKGMHPRDLMAELFGRATGCSQGRGGSMHLFAPEIGLMGTSGIVGPCILQACGGGYSSKLLKDQGVSVAFFGDGAVNNGAFHEGLNMASIWKLPVLFVCENNEFATEVPFAYSAGHPGVADRGPAYGMPGIEVDGNDVREVSRVTREAVARARGGGGPTLIECKTYRTRAHAEGMGDFGYRTKEEVETWKLRCPIARLRQWLIDNSDASIVHDLDDIDESLKAEVRASRQEAENAPWPQPESAGEHVYGPPHRISPVSVPSAERRITYSQATHEALAHAMETDPRIFVLGEGIGERGGNFLTTKGLFEIYGPQRLCDTPLCERGFIGLACGAAMTGTRPVVDFMFADFILDGMGEIINQIAKMRYMSSGRLKMPVVLRGCIGAGHSVATHHSGSYYAMFGQVPGLRVAVPSSAYDAKGLLNRALRGDDPVMFLEHRELLQNKSSVPEEDYEIEFGQAAVVRPGSDITVVALGRMVHLAREVAEELEGDGLSVEVIDPRTISPLDTETILKSVHKTGRLLIVDESPAAFGFSAEVAAAVVRDGFDDLDAPIERLTGAFCPTPYSPPLEESLLPNAGRISTAIRELVRR